jgi:hypothetical protein
MKTMIVSIATALVLTSLCVLGSFAQADKKGATGPPSLVAASEIKGTHVKNLQNQDLGEIEEVLIEAATGHVRFVVLEVGGFLGLGATKVAVPWTAFQLAADGKKWKWVLDADKERLKNAPKVGSKHDQKLDTRTEAEPIFTYWKIIWIEPVTSGSPTP